jgi:hypothetical protein
MYVIAPLEEESKKYFIIHMSHVFVTTTVQPFAQLGRTIDRRKAVSMSRPRFPRLLSCLIAVIATSMMPVSVSTQWTPSKSPAIPRAADGKPDLLAPAPRTSDGRPDLSGVWEVPVVDGIPKFAINLAADLPSGSVPLQPWAAALLKERMDDLGKDYPASRCLPPGVPNLTLAPLPFKIIQTPGLVVILYEALTTFRQVFMDGRALPEGANPTWMGYSVGAWDGDRLVVRTAGFNDKTWLDIAGHPATEALQVTERFRRRDFSHLDIELTIDDPKAYTRPWTVTVGATLLPDADLIEFVCNENEKDLPHLVGK